MSAWEQYRKTIAKPQTLWSVAKENEISVLLHLLGDGTNVNVRDHRGYSPLMLAAYAGNSDAVALRFRNGCLRFRGNVRTAKFDEFFRSEERPVAWGKPG